jgi:hypothetical protein
MRLFVQRAAVAVVAALAVSGVGLAGSRAPAVADTGCKWQVGVNDVTQKEGTGPGYTVFEFTVSVAVPVPCSGLLDGELGYQTQDGGPPDQGPAVAGSDYVQAEGTIGLDADHPADQKTIDIHVSRNASIEADEAFSVLLGDATSNVHIVDGHGVGRILNDDNEWYIRGDGMPYCTNVLPCRYRVEASQPVDETVTVEVGGVDDTAIHNEDYVLTDTTRTVPRGASRASGGIRILPNVARDRARRFYVRIVSVSSGSIVVGQVEVNIAASASARAFAAR